LDIISGKQDKIEDISWIDFNQLKVDESTNGKLLLLMINIILLNIFKPSFLQRKLKEFVNFIFGKEFLEQGVIDFKLAV